VDRWPIIYIRGYAGPTSGIDTQVDDPFYGFNKGATHVRADGDGDPAFYQFEGPLLRLITEHGYELQVRGDQRRVLDDLSQEILPNTIWVHRFYDEAATTFRAQPKRSILQRAGEWLHQHVAADGYDIEEAAADLYVLVEKVLARTGADRVYLVAHSMGGLIARCMIQKICGTSAQDGTQRRAAKQIIAKLFTYGTPHGGIATDLAAVNKAMELFGPAGSDIFAPTVMYSYLTPGVSFGDTNHVPDDWDPRTIPSDIFDVDDVFCIVGTDPADYGLSKIVVGPRSDGLVRIENAYVKGAHRAFVFKSHSGSYGEVNSEEGYQNLRRFLFARWSVSLSFAGVSADASHGGASWQADMRLAIRGLPIIMSEQQAAHWCPIILTKEARMAEDSINAPVPIVSTFLFHPEPEGPDRPAGEAASFARYVLTLRAYKIVQKDGAFEFRDHIEQVADWADSLIVDIGPDEDGKMAAWTGWNAEVMGALDSVPRMPTRLQLAADETGVQRGTVQLPAPATVLPIFKAGARLAVTVADREHTTT
jgi:pimeloyl-ACP methyl ester carboxylesterase